MLHTVSMCRCSFVAGGIRILTRKPRVLDLFAVLPDLVESLARVNSALVPVYPLLTDTCSVDFLSRCLWLVPACTHTVMSQILLKF